MIGNRLHTLVNNPFSETALTIAGVFGAVTFTNSIGVSGLIVVARGGLFFGNVTMKRKSTMSPEVKKACIIFLANCGFFCKFCYIFLFRNNHEYSDYRTKFDSH